MSKIEQDIKLDFSDVLIKPKMSHLHTRSEIGEKELIRTFKQKNIGDGTRKDVFSGIGIIASNMDTTGTIEMAQVLGKLKCFTALHKFYLRPDTPLYKQLKEFLLSNRETELIDYIWFTIGKSKVELNNLIRLLHDVQWPWSCSVKICVDVANGMQERFVDFVYDVKMYDELREYFGSPVILAGNVVTPDMTTQLVQAGADIVKCGIGSGASCYTRKKTGVGFPQLSAVLECADAARQRGAYLCSDGGCVDAGDVCKALGANASMVMLGSMLAGHAESGGDVVEKDGIKYKEVYGMSSEKAMKKYYGKMESYKTSEGRYSLIPYRGSVKNTIEEILGGIRSMMTYIGASDVKQIPVRTTFIRVNKQLNEAFKNYTIGE